MVFIPHSVELSCITSTPENVYINILMIAAFKEDGDSSMADKILSNVSSLLRSILEHTQGTPLHLIILTNKHSMVTIRLTIRVFIHKEENKSKYLYRNVIKKVIGKHLSELIIKNYTRGRYIFPKLLIEFASLPAIAKKYSSEIEKVCKIHM